MFLAIQSNKLRVFIAVALIWSTTFAGNLPKVSPEKLNESVSNNLSRVEEFKFIEQQARELGLRAWLFGGTAAAFAHYTKWDTLRESGEKRLQKDRFDYDYSNIFRSNQDLDLVVDGPPHAARELEARLKEKFPHFQGSKSAWEVRLLRESMGNKEALLANPDFLKQHTDSNSTGMIEITAPKGNEPRVRDLRDWDSKEPYFLNDVAEGKLHFYFSKEHEKTSRARQGLNPPILAAIRYLTKAFQYELDVREEDLAEVKKIVAAFDPKRDINNDYLKMWIEKNGKKLFQNAINIEYAWDVLEKLGLRTKLQKIFGNTRDQDSLAWWMNKEPLRSKALGAGSGKTAKQLGLSTVAHETKDFFAYESITRSHLGEPNVFISRNNAVGETAAHGNGFYVRKGREGAAGTGFTIRFRLHPDAREGSDFERASTDYIVIKNRNALEVIPESFQFSVVEYFQYLSGQNQINESDTGILERLRRRVNNKLSSIQPSEMYEISEIVKESARKKKFNPLLYDSWKKIPGHETYGIKVPNDLDFESILARMESELKGDMRPDEWNGVKKRYLTHAKSAQQFLRILEFVPEDKTKHPFWVNARGPGTMRYFTDMLMENLHQFASFNPTATQIDYVGRKVLLPFGAREFRGRLADVQAARSSNPLTKCLNMLSRLVRGF